MKIPLLKCIKKYTLILLLSSCLKPIDFPVERNGGTLVVTGQISTMSDQNVIQLSSTAIARLPIPISGATIRLFDDIGNEYTYSEDFENLGTYELTSVDGVVGRTYHIEIELPDGGSFKSLPEKLPESAILESVNYSIGKKELIDGEGAVVTRDYLDLYSNSRLYSTNKLVYLKWNVEEVFLLSPTDFPDIEGRIPPPCFITQNADPQRIVLFNGSEVSANSINNIMVASRLIDWTFLEKHYFTIYQSSLTLEAYDYWRKVNIVANQVGTIFDTPPAAITGNVVSKENPAQKVLGYFQAVNQTSSRIVIFPTDLPFPLLFSTCVFDGNFDPLYYPSRCIDCLTVRNSSYERPDWF